MSEGTATYRTFRAKLSECRTLRSSSVDGESRTLCNREYVVISVVALVEGVRHGGGSEAPELVMADSFGRHVATWNGRPIVVDHPTNDDGEGILASEAGVLESSYLGVMMNSKLEDGKLITEAWLDTTAISKSKSSKIKGMWKRLSAGETVEVSVGAIVYTKDVSGKYHGKEYSGRWEIVIPDHLAFLTGEQIGACSVADGCGTFRTQNRALSSGVDMAGASLKHGTTMLSSDGEGTQPSDGDCSCDSKKSEPCTCKDKKTLSTEQTILENLKQYGSARARTLFSKETLSSDRLTLLNRAIKTRLKSAYIYAYAYNDSIIVFTKYESGEGYKDYSISYESGEDDSVTLGAEDPVEVMIQAKVVKAPSTSTKEKDRKMAGKKKLSAADQNAREDVLNLLDEDDEEEAAVETTTAQLSSRDKDRVRKLHFGSVETMDQLKKLLNGTPIGKQLNRQLATAEAATNKVIEFIRATPQGKFFSVEMLKDMDFTALDTMAKAYVSTAQEGSEETDGDTAPQKGAQQVAPTNGAGAGDPSMAFMQYGKDHKEKPRVPAQQQRNFSGRAGGGRNLADNAPPTPPNVFDN